MSFNITLVSDDKLSQLIAFCKFPSSGGGSGSGPCEPLLDKHPFISEFI